MARHLTVPDQPSAARLLARIIESPSLVAQIRTLTGPVLARLIDRIGLEDAGEIVAFASTEQLAQVFDEDIWRSERPGADERFDADRFAVWLEVMLEAGDRFVADRLAELPLDLVTLALHRQVLVLESDALVAFFQDDETASTEQALWNCANEELGPYHLVSRRADGWDSVFAALVALDSEHHDLLMAILERCCRMSGELIDDSGGLYEVLTSAETLEADVAGEREERRAAAGYVSPAAATAFLRLARRGDDSSRDALTQAYFRRLGGTAPDSPAAPTQPTPGETEGSDLMALLRESGALERADAPLLLEGPGGEAPPDELLLVRALRLLADEEPERFLARSEEIGYLANVLAAGCVHRGGGLRSADAARVALAACNLGLESALQRHDAGGDADDAAAAALREASADRLFRTAWRRLAREVIGPAAEAAERCLRAVAANSDPDDAAELLRAANRLGAASRGGVAWTARSEVEMLHGVLDGALLEALLGLIDECPALNGEFIATSADLGAVSELLASLPGASK